MHHSAIIRIFLIAGVACCGFGERMMAQSDSFALNAIFAEQHVAESGVYLCQQANLLDDADALALLHAWVIPNESHSQFRVTVDFVSPTHPLAASARRPSEAGMVSPALQLVRLAVRLDEVDSLQRSIEAAPVESPLQQCHQATLLFLLARSSGENDRAAMLLDRLFSSVLNDKALLDDTHADVLICAYESVDSNPLAKIVREVMPGITEQYKTDYTRPAWMRHLWAARADLERGSINIFDPGDQPQWHGVSRSTALEHGSGFPATRWQIENGSVRKLSSYGDDFLFFASPLEGDYEVECEATGFGYREAHIMLGGIWHGLVFNHRQYMVGNVRGELQRIDLPSPLTDTHRHGFIHTRVVKQGQSSTTYFNGAKIVDAQLFETPYPWLAIRNLYRVHGGVDDLRITGSPTIPDAIEMVESPVLLGWYDYYQSPEKTEWLGQWRAEIGRDDSGNRTTEIVDARTSEHAPGTNVERLLIYTRPVLEDGVIEYEYWYSPDSVAAHPVIGRSCFLLDAEGIKLHQLTDGRFERTALRPGNTTELLRRDLPLHADAWNRVKLQVQGDTLNIWLNGETVYQHELTSHPTERTFGLFHFADRSELRVRNPVWTGDWPKSLPPTTQQLLADTTHEFLNQTAQELAAEFVHEFNSQSILLGKVAAVEGDPTGDLIPTDDGMLIKRDGKKGYSGTMVSPSLRIGGDFDVELTFEDFLCSTSVGNIGSVRIAIQAENDSQDLALIQRVVDREGGQAIQCLKMETIQGSQRRHYFGGQPMDGGAARLRICRRGGQVYYLFAENDSRQFRMMGSQEFGTEDVAESALRFGVQVQGEGGKSQARLKRLVVRAERLSGPALDRDALLTKLNDQRDQLAVSIQHDFAVEAPDPNEFYSWTDLDRWKASDGGLMIEALGADIWTSAGLSFRDKLIGDFDITFSFEAIRLQLPEQGKHTQVYLQLEFEDQGNTQLSGMLTKTAGGDIVTQGQVRLRGDNGYKYEVLGTLAIDDPDYIRIARRGSDVYFLTGFVSGQREYIVASTRLNAEPLKFDGVRMMLHTGNVAGTSQMLARSIDIRAADRFPRSAIFTPAELDDRSESIPESIFNSLKGFFQ